MVQLKTCTKCGKKKELTEFYKSNHSKIGRAPICKNCASIRGKEYRKNNKEKETKRGKLYRDNHKEEKKISRTKWYEENKEQVLKQSTDWRKNHKKQKSETDKKWKINNPEKVLEANKRSNTKRKRNFGYIPLNKKFLGSVGHHISKDLVVHIPEELHKSIPHRYDDPISMGQINGLALEFMMLEVG